MENEEIWLPIAGWEGFYEVSNLGRVRSVSRWIRTPRGSGNSWLLGRVLKGWDRGGYEFVGVSVRGHVYKRSVHRLVAAAFCEQPPDCDVVNHIDGNRANNAAWNLEWADKSWNALHGMWVLHPAYVGPGAKLTAEQVAWVRSQSGLVSQREMARRLGVDQSAVSAAVRRKTYRKAVTGVLVRLRESGHVRRCNERLNESMVREIRASAGKHTQAALAAQYGVTRSTISRILLRKRWRHVQ